MSIVKKFNPLKNLDQIDILVDDFNQSRHFVITDLPESLPQGRSSFLIETGPFLKDGVELQIDFVDSEGNSIYYEPIEDYLEGTSRRISVEIYSDTGPGVANLIIVGELDSIPLSEGAFSDVEAVPEDWKNIYNVRLTKEIIINPTEINTEPIRFYTQPKISVSEKRFGSLVRTETSASISSSFNSIEGLPDQNFEFTVFETEDPKQGSLSEASDKKTKPKNKTDSIFKLGNQFKNKKGKRKSSIFKRIGHIARSRSPIEYPYSFRITNSDEFTTKDIGARVVLKTINSSAYDREQFDTSNIPFPPTLSNYTGSIAELRNNKIALLEKPFTNKNTNNEDVIIPFFGTAEIIKQAEPTSSYSTANIISYADVALSDMRTFSGDIFKAKIMVRSEGSFDDFKTLAEIPVESSELMIDPLSVGLSEHTGYYENQANINTYWTTTGGTSTFSNAPLLDGVYVSGSVATFENQIKYSLKNAYKFSLTKNIDFTLSFNAYTERGNDTRSLLAVYISGSSFSHNSDIFVDSATNKVLVDDNSYGYRLGIIEVDDQSEKDLGLVVQNFTPQNTGDAVVQFRVIEGSWYFSDISVKPSEDTGFSPSTFTFQKEMPLEFQHKRPDTFEFLVEFYDANDNIADSLAFNTGSLFTGGNVVISGNDNIQSGDMFLGGDSTGSGIHFGGIDSVLPETGQDGAEGSGFIRSIGYQGFVSASNSSLGGKFGFMIYSGSVLPSSGDNYAGVGLELVGASGSLKFRTNPSIFEVVADAFFVGSTSTQFISGSTGAIEISSSNFHLTPQGNVTMSGIITAEGGNIGDFKILGGQISGSNMTFNAPRSQLFKTDQGPGSDTVAQFDEKRDEYYIDFTPSGSGDADGTNYYIKMGPSFMVDKDGILIASGAEFVGTITASAGLIGGFTTDSHSFSSNNIFISGSPLQGSVDDSKHMFISTSNFNVKQSGDITGSKVLFTGGKLGGFNINNTSIRDVNNTVELSSALPGLKIKDNGGTDRVLVKSGSLSTVGGGTQYIGNKSFEEQLGSLSAGRNFVGSINSWSFSEGGAVNISLTDRNAFVDDDKAVSGRVTLDVVVPAGSSNYASTNNYQISQIVTASIASGDTLSFSSVARFSSSFGGRGKDRALQPQYFRLEYSGSGTNGFVPFLPHPNFTASNGYGEYFLGSGQYNSFGASADLPSSAEFIKVVLTGSINDDTGFTVEKPLFIGDKGTVNSDISGRKFTKQVVGSTTAEHPETEITFDNFSLRSNSRRVEMTQEGLLIYNSEDSFIKMTGAGIEIRGGSGVANFGTAINREAATNDSQVAGTLGAPALQAYQSDPEDIGTTASDGNVGEFAKGNHVHRLTFSTVNSVLAGQTLTGTTFNGLFGSNARIAISGSLGTNADVIRSLNRDTISGSLGSNAAVIRTLARAGISGSLGANASVIRTLTRTGISGSLGSNAALIRSLTRVGISGSLSANAIRDLGAGILSGSAGSMNSFNISDGATTELVADSNTITFAAGTGLDVAVSATDTVTYTVDVSDFLSNGVDNRVLTATGADAMNAESGLTFDGNDLGVTRKIFHIGDTDTFINFTNDDINIQAGGVNFIDITEDTTNEITFNEEGVVINVRMESNNDANLFFLDGANDKIGIGLTTPNAKLEVKGSDGSNSTENTTLTDSSGNHLFTQFNGGKAIFHFGPVEFPYANGKVSGSSTTTASFGRIQVPKGKYLEFLGGGAGTAEKWQIFNSNSNVFEIKSTAYGGSPITIDATGGGVNVAANLDVGSGLDVAGNITVTGNVDGRDVATDGSKLDGIESGATADQSNAEIRAAVEAASDSNVFTDADHSKLNAIESSATADQTITAGSGLTGGGSGDVTLNVIGGTGITANADNITTTDSEIVHDNLSGFVANEHIDHSGVEIIAGSGLSGGGTIESSRTINIGAGSGIDVSTNTISVDVSDFMTNGSDNRVLTATGADAMNAEANLTFDGTILSGSAQSTGSFGKLVSAAGLNLGGVTSDLFPHALTITDESPAIVLNDSNVSNLQHRIFGGGNAGLEVSIDANNVAAGYFRVDLGGAEKMRLIESGNLGIGRSTPTYKLDVNGDLLVTKTSGNLARFTGAGASSFYISATAQITHTSTTGNTAFAINQAGSGDAFSVDSSALIVKADGKVGIGTDNPGDYRLYLNHDSEDVLKLYNTTDGQDALISFQNPGGTLGRIQGIDNGGLAFDTGNNAGGMNSNVMFISNAANVGIGTTNPGKKFVVETTTDYDGIEVRDVNAVARIANGSADDGYIQLLKADVGKVQIHSNGTSYFTGGTVGIGTTNPGVALLSVFSTTAGAPFLYVGDSTPNNDSNWDANIMLDSHQHARIRVENRSDNKNLEIYSHTGGNPKIRATDSATAVVIGVGGTDSITIGTNPYLTVHDDAAVQGDLTVTGDLTVNGTTTTVATTNMVVSDNLIELNNGASSNANDSGIVIERGSTGDNAIFVWDESADRFLVGTTTATGASTGNLTITAAPLETAALTSTTVDTGQGATEVHLMNQNVRTSDAVTFATVDTGQGANELFAMNQDVETTDTVTFGEVRLVDSNTRILEGGGNSVKIQTNSGYIQIGPQNTSYAHIETDRAQFYFNKKVIVDSGLVSSYDEDLVLQRAGTNKLTLGNTITTSHQDFALSDTKTLGTSTFISGITGDGFRIDDNGSDGTLLEIDNIVVRNTLRTHIFQKDVVKATNGILFISDSGVISGSTGTTGTGTVTFEDDKSATFSDDQILLFKDAQDNGTINAVRFQINGSPITGGSVQSGFTQYNVDNVAGNLSNLNVGGTAARISGGTVAIDASSPNSPFVDVNAASGSAVVRMGNLAGITSPRFGTLSNQFGLWASGSAYLEGAINAKTGNIGTWGIGNTAISSSEGIITLDASAKRITITDGTADRIYLGEVDGGTVYGLKIFDGAATNDENRLVELGEGANMIAGWDIMPGAIKSDNQDGSVALSSNSQSLMIFTGSIDNARPKVVVGKLPRVNGSSSDDRYGFGVFTGTVDADITNDLTYNVLITRDKAKLAGWDLVPGNIQSDNTFGSVRLSSISQSLTIWTGSVNEAQPKLVLGKLPLHDGTDQTPYGFAVFSGSGTVSGSQDSASILITANKAKLAGWELVPGQLKSGTVARIDGNQATIALGANAHQTHATAQSNLFYVSASATPTFFVGANFSFINNTLTAAGWEISTNSIKKSTDVVIDSNAKSITLGDGAIAIENNSGTPQIRSATNFTTGDGFFLSSAATNNFRVGKAGAQRLQFDGTNLEIYNSTPQLLVSLGASNQIAGWTISTTSFSKNDVALISTGNAEGLYVKKTSFGDNTAGGFLGLDGGVAKFNVGNASKFIKFDGNHFTVNAGNFSLDASGNMTATSATLTGTVTATAGAIGGFGISATTVSSSNSNLILRSNGQITGSTVLLKGGKIGGTTLATGSMFSGTGTHGDGNTPFFMDSGGRFSLGDKLVWDGNSLSVSGQITITSGTGFATPSDVSTLSGSVASDVAGLTEASGNMSTQVSLTSDGMSLNTGAGTSLASYGTTTRIGLAADARTEISSTAISMYSGKISGTAYKRVAIDNTGKIALGGTTGADVSVSTTDDVIRIDPSTGIFVFDNNTDFVKIASDGFYIHSGHASNRSAKFTDEISLYGGSDFSVRTLHITNDGINIGKGATGPSSANTPSAVIGNISLHGAGARIYGAAVDDYVDVKSDGVDVVAAGVTQAAFGATTTIGNTSNNEYVNIDSNGVKVYGGASDDYVQMDADSFSVVQGGVVVSDFGSSIIIGNSATDKSALRISSGAITLGTSNTQNVTIAANGDVSMTGTVTAGAGAIGGFGLTATSITGSGIEMIAGTNSRFVLHQTGGTTPGMVIARNSVPAAANEAAFDMLGGSSFASITASNAFVEITTDFNLGTGADSSNSTLSSIAGVTLSSAFDRPVESDCFIAGTQILMANGSTKNIEDIVVGDLVKTYDVVSNQIISEEVAYAYDTIHTGEDDDYTIIIEFENGIINHNTFTNPYWVVGKGYASYDPIETYKKYKLEVEQLSVGDIGLTSEGIETKIKSVTKVTDEIHTYNFHVVKNENYFANNILVHNKRNFGKTSTAKFSAVTQGSTSALDEGDQIYGIIGEGLGDNSTNAMTIAGAFLSSSRGHSSQADYGMITPSRISVGGSQYNNESTPAIIFNGGISSQGSVIHGNGRDDTGIFSDAAYKIQIAVSGTKRFQVDTAGVDVFGALTATGDVTAFHSSDKRLKENIELIKNPIEKVKQIRGVEFDWKEGNEDIHEYEGHDVGVIAQDIEKVMPEVVKDREDGYKGVRYEKMVGLLIEGMKEQQKQIEDLKSEVKELKNGSS